MIVAYRFSVVYARMQECNVRLLEEGLELSVNSLESGVLVADAKRTEHGGDGIFATRQYEAKLGIHGEQLRILRCNVSFEHSNGCSAAHARIAL